MARPPQPSPPRRHSPNVAGSRDGMDNETGTESLVSHRRERARRRNREEGNEATPLTSPGPHGRPKPLLTPRYCPVQRGSLGRGSRTLVAPPATQRSPCQLPGQQVL